MIEQNAPCISIPDVLTSNTVEQNENISEDGEDEDFEGELINAHASVSSDITDAASELSKLKTTYRQRYKAAWELEHLFKDWLAPFSGDSFAAYCRICRCKLHAHKKGLLAHAKSIKHKKHYSTSLDSSVTGAVDTPIKKVKKTVFNEQWLEDSSFSLWLKKIPNNTSKAYCSACRSVITAGRSELLKHTQSAKHKKAIESGVQEIPQFELDYFDPTYNTPQSYAMANGEGSHSSMALETTGVELCDVMSQLNELVPLHLAESWDNVGLLIQPSGAHRVRTIFLTIDLTEKVMEEAIKNRANLIISYHPPIFRPLKRLTQRNWKERLIIQCTENRIALYSPHTALDAVSGGINDWLVSAYGMSKVSVISQKHAQANSNGNYAYCLDVVVPEVEQVADYLKHFDNVTVKRLEYGGNVRVNCDEQTIPKVLKVLNNHYSGLCPRITKQEPVPLLEVGMGRVANLDAPLSISEVVEKTKSHLQQYHVRLALADHHTEASGISSIAVCAGSGSGVLNGVRAELFVTGEMSHHDVLDALHSGTSVILCEHTNTERGYLQRWAEQLKVVFPHTNILVSEFDKDPLCTV